MRLLTCTAFAPVFRVVPLVLAVITADGANGPAAPLPSVIDVALSLTNTFAFDRKYRLAALVFTPPPEEPMLPESLVRDTVGA